MIVHKNIQVKPSPKDILAQKSSKRHRHNIDKAYFSRWADPDVGCDISPDGPRECSEILSALPNLCRLDRVQINFMCNNPLLYVRGSR